MALGYSDSVEINDYLLYCSNMIASSLLYLFSYTLSLRKLGMSTLVLY